MSAVLRLVVVSLCAGHVHGYPGGAGVQACPQGSPQVCHGAKPQTSPSPYSVTVHGESYSPGSTVNVTLALSTGSTPFVGFLLGAHRVSGDSKEYLGSFSTTPNTQPRCGTSKNTGATQTNSDGKVNLTLEWTAPDTDEGDLVFTCAFVQHYDTYWVNVTSTPLKAINYPPSNHTTATTPPGDTTAPSSSSEFPKDNACGNTKSCYGDCTDDRCSLLVTWYKADQSLIFTIKSVVTSGDNFWTAVGFSKSAAMNVASVVDCVANAGHVQAFTSVNRDYDNHNVSPDEKAGLSNMTGMLEDGVLTCSVHRQLVVAAGPDVFNLTTPYHVLLARGPASGWTKLPHDVDYVTDDSYDLTSVVDIHARPQSNLLVQLHGCLMAVAWVLSGSIGVLVARFYKGSWGTQTACGVKVWFSIHRTAMIITFLATAAGFVTIFVHVQGYSQLSGLGYQKAHPVLGIIVTGLTVLNPIMSVFRCAPDHEYRPLFNWAHWFVGSCAYILGVLTVAIGTRLQAASTPDYVTYIVAAFGAWHVLTHFLLEINKGLERSDPIACTYKDLQTFSTSLEGMKYRLVRQTLFSLHVFIALAACIAIVDGIIYF